MTHRWDTLWMNKQTRVRTTSQRGDICLLRRFSQLPQCLIDLMCLENRDVCDPFPWSARLSERSRCFLFMLASVGSVGFSLLIVEALWNACGCDFKLDWLVDGGVLPGVATLSVFWRPSLVCQALWTTAMRGAGGHSASARVSSGPSQWRKKVGPSWSSGWRNLPPPCPLCTSTRAAAPSS